MWGLVLFKLIMGKVRKKIVDKTEEDIHIIREEAKTFNGITE